MRVPSFEYIEPQTVKEACALLAQNQGKAKVIAGGTDLMVMMKQRVIRPAYLVNIKKIKELDFIDYNGDSGLRVGPLVTLNALAEHPVVMEHFSALSQAAGSVASPNIRNLATIGGNLCLDSKCWYYNQTLIFRQGRTPCFKRGGDRCYVITGGKFCYALAAADTVAALIALGAEAKIASASDERTVPVAEFFTGKGETVNVLGPQDVVTEIRIPTPPGKSASAFLKQAFRGSNDFGITNAAVSITMNGSGECKDARIAITAVSPSPISATKAAETLKGKKIDAALTEEAGQAAASEARPVSAIWTSVYHRRKLIAAMVKQTIQAAAERLGTT